MSDIPVGYCQCGCGERTKIAICNRKKSTTVKGEHFKYIATHQNQRKEVDFWSEVDKSGECWVWTGSRNPRGYGRLRADGKYWGAHRYAWMITNGQIPEGLHVLHKCDNPPCCNPSHLFLGTHKENMHDMVLKKRRFPTVGEANPNCKLTNEQIQEIRTLGNMKKTDIAKKYNIAREYLYRILTYQTRAEVTP